MAQSFGFSNWWPKEAKKGTPMVVKMENPNYLVLEIDDPDGGFGRRVKADAKIAKQVTWVLLLKAHRVVGCVAWIASLFWALLGAIKKRLIFRENVATVSEKNGEREASLHCHHTLLKNFPYNSGFRALSKFCVALFLTENQIQK